jgi:O-antigen/teichoic acid export membrane protein
MSNSSGNLAKNSFHSLFSSFILAVTSLGITSIISRLLGAEGKGTYDLLIASGSLVSTMIGLSLSSGVTYLSAKLTSHVNTLLKTISRFLIFQTFFALSVIFAIKDNYFFAWLSPPQLNTIISSAIILALFCVTLSNSYLRSVLIGMQKIILVNQVEYWGKIFYFLSLAVILLFSFLGKNDYINSISLLICLITINIITIFRLYLLVRDQNNYEEHGKTSHTIISRQIILYSLPCYFGNLLQFLNYKADIFILSYFHVSMSKLGAYTLAATIAQLIWLFPASISTSLLPKIAATKKDESIDLVTQITRIVLTISFIAGTIIFIISPWLIPYLFGSSFSESVMAIQYLIPGIVSFTIVNVIAAYIAGIALPQVNFYISTIGFLVTLCFDIILIPRLGIYGAAIASSLSYITSAICSLIWITQKYSISPWEVIIIRRSDICMIQKYILSTIKLLVK